MAENNKIPNIYIIGYQPMDIIDVRFRVIDLMSVILSTKNPEEINLRLDIIEFLEKEKELFNENYLLVNTKTNKTFLPYTASKKTIVFDPPYIPHTSEVEHLLFNIQSLIGVKQRMNKELIATTAGTYNNSLNGMRNLIFQTQEFLAPGDYYNCLTLLSDMNSCSKADLQSFIEKRGKFKYDKTADYKFVLYFGDPVNPEFFNALFNKGYIVVKYLPYDQYLQPCTDVYEYYAGNFLFQTPLFNVVTIRNILREYAAEGVNIEFCIINPGSVYLTREDAEFYMRRLSNELPFKIVKGYNPTVEELGI